MARTGVRARSVALTPSAMHDSLDSPISSVPENAARAPSPFDRNWLETAVETPAFVYSEAVVNRHLLELDALRNLSGCRVLYAVKALAWQDVLRLVQPAVDGFAVSSVFEARQAQAANSSRDRVHFSSTAVAPGELEELAQHCSWIVFNSLSQWDRYSMGTADHVRCGLRVNPGLSLVEDARCDPCRPHSKLGVPLGRLAGLSPNRQRRLQRLSGLHVHNNHNATTFDGLLQTVKRIENSLGPLLGQLAWINIGGGYLFGSGSDPDPLCEAVQRLREHYGLEVFFEPGAALVQDACALVTTVLDVIHSGGREVAVLDTSVNHLPRVFEYQSRPPVSGERPGAPYRYILAGRSCLAGDLFGSYAFDAPLRPGSRLAITDAGAYSLAKASWFNGIRLPNVYVLEENGGLSLRRRFTYGDYARLNMADNPSSSTRR